MTVNAAVAHDRLDDAVERLEVRIDEGQRRLSTRTVPDERVPAAVYDLGKAHDALARTLLLLGEVDRAREAYAEGTVYYLASVRESADRRGMLRPRERHDDPWTCVHAIERGLLGGRGDLVECVARETLSMGQPFLVEHDNRSYYAAKLLAAVVLDEDEWSRHAEEYRHAVGDRPDPSEESRLFVYEGIAEDDTAKVARGLEGMLERRGQFAGKGEDPPGQPVDDWLAALVLLAREKGLDLTVEAPTVPAGLLPDPDSFTRVVKPEAPEEWYPDVHHDAPADEYVLTETVTYPGEGPLTAEDLPEVEGDRVLSDAWVDATVDRLRTADDEDRNELAEDIVAARQSGTLRRRLVVEAGASGRSSVRVDRSVFDLGIDDVEVRTS